MAANRIGKLYRYKKDLPIWGGKNFLSESDVIAAGSPFLILDKKEQFGKQYAYILYKEIMGWIDVSYIDLEWLDPECEV